MSDERTTKQPTPLPEDKEIEQAPRGLTLREAQEILERVATIDSSAFTSLEDMARLGRFQDAFAVVAFHILLNSPQVAATTFHLGPEGHAALNSHWDNYSLDLYYPEELIAQLQQQSQEQISRFRTVPTPSEIKIFGMPGGYSFNMWLNYQETPPDIFDESYILGKTSTYQIKVSRNSNIGLLEGGYNRSGRVYKERSAGADDRDSTHDPKLCFPFLAEGVKLASQIMVTRSRFLPQSLQRPANLPPLLPPAPGR